MTILETIKESPVVVGLVQGGRAVWGWSSQHLWPLYSTGAIVSALAVVAAVHEKQMVADHLYGSNPVLKEEGEEMMRRCASQFEDALQRGVKEDVYGLSQSQFQAEMRARGE
eukprot:353386_1